MANYSNQLGTLNIGHMMSFSTHYETIKVMERPYTNLIHQTQAVSILKSSYQYTV